MPLLFFGVAAHHLRLSTLGFLQYLAPTGQFLLAVTVLVLFFARDLLILFAFAMMLAFLLAPAVTRLEAARIPRVVYGATDPKAGAAGSVWAYGLTGPAGAVLAYGLTRPAGAGWGSATTGAMVVAGRCPKNIRTRSRNVIPDQARHARSEAYQSVGQPSA